MTRQTFNPRQRIRDAWHRQQAILDRGRGFSVLVGPPIVVDLPVLELPSWILEPQTLEGKKHAERK